MRKIFGKMFKQAASNAASPNQAINMTYPDDYSSKCAEAIKGIKASNGDFEAIQESGAEQLFLDSVDWINQGQEIDLVSFLKLIKAIRKFIPGDSWIESNKFKVDHDLYSEGINREEFFLESANSQFILELISLGEDGNHFACCVLSDLGEKLSQEFLQDLLNLLVSQKQVFECNHWQETPVPGSPLIEIIRTKRLSSSQLEDLYNYVSSKKNETPQYLLSMIELYLSQSRETPNKLLKKFSKNNDSVWAWVDKDGTEVFSEAVVAEYAQREIASRR